MDEIRIPLMGSARASGRAIRLAAATALLGTCLILSPARADAQEGLSSSTAPGVRVDGLVLDLQKYSFSMQGPDRIYDVVIPNGTPMYLKLTLPEIDFDRQVLSVELLLSAPDGDFRNNFRVDHALPEPVYLNCEFETRAALDDAMAESVPEFESFTLTSNAPVPDPLKVSGELRAGREPGEYLLVSGIESKPVRLGPRKGYLGDQKITDLRPHATEVYVEGYYEGNRLIAESIRFQFVGDPFARFDPALPNALIIGDQISLNYDAALRTALAGKVNVHHPPCNCGGAENWRDIHRWLANPNQDNRRWEVIAFNFGLRDKSASEAVWKANLREAIHRFQATGARLVWITSTPVPEGFPSADGSQPLGMVQGRMALQNQWAADVLQEFPEIEICDLWQRVRDDASGVWTHWWRGRKTTFNGNESQPLGEAVADAILQAADSAVSR